MVLTNKLWQELRSRSPLILSIFAEFRSSVFDFRYMVPTPRDKFTALISPFHSLNGYK
jgi:hypothetical protein